MFHAFYEKKTELTFAPDIDCPYTDFKRKLYIVYHPSEDKFSTNVWKSIFQYSNLPIDICFVLFILFLKHRKDTPAEQKEYACY